MAKTTNPNPYPKVRKGMSLHEAYAARAAQDKYSEWVRTHNCPHAEVGTTKTELFQRIKEFHCHKCFLREPADGSKGTVLREAYRAMLAREQAEHEAEVAEVQAACEHHPRVVYSKWLRLPLKYRCTVCHKEEPIRDSKGRPFPVA